MKEDEKTEANQVPELTVPLTITLRVDDTFDPMSNVKAIDKEDGDLTNRVEHKGDVDTSKPGNTLWITLSLILKAGMQRQHRL